MSEPLLRSAHRRSQWRRLSADFSDPVSMKGERVSRVSPLHPGGTTQRTQDEFSLRGSVRSEDAKAWVALVTALPLTVMLLSFLPLWEDATTAKYCMTFFVFSVFPAPDSPLKDMSVVTLMVIPATPQVRKPKLLLAGAFTGYVQVHIWRPEVNLCYHAPLRKKKTKTRFLSGWNSPIRLGWLGSEPQRSACLCPSPC